MESYLEIKIEQPCANPEGQLKTKSELLHEVTMINSTKKMASSLLEEDWAVAVNVRDKKIITSVKGTPLPKWKYEEIKDNYRAVIDILKLDGPNILGENTNICLTYILEEKAEPKELGSEEFLIGKATVYLKAQNL